MVAITLTIAFIASCLVLNLKLSKAFAVLIITLLVYPTFLVVRLGTIDIAAVRIVTAFLLLRCLSTPSVCNRFKLCASDKWVICFAVITVLVPLFVWQMSLGAIIENRLGYILDSYLVYFLARLCITNRSDFKGFLRWVSVVLFGLAILGLIESFTGWQPFVMMKKYCPWYVPSRFDDITNIRFGLLRAVGPLDHSILFGATFAMFIPLFYSMRKEIWEKSYLIKICLFMMVIGSLTSMSSGAWMMLIITFICFYLEKHRNWVKPLIYFGIFSCVFIGLISNRPFYHVLVSYLNPLGGSGWHRARLIDLAIENISDWWLVGYRGEDPGWGQSLGMTWSDITNHYLVIGVQYGLIGLVCFICIFVVLLMAVLRKNNSTKDIELKSWCWAMASGLVVLLIVFNTFTLFAQANTLLYAILGMVASISTLKLKQPAFKI